MNKNSTRLLSNTNPNSQQKDHLHRHVHWNARDNNTAVRRQRIVSVDIDGTVADVTRRREYALQFGEDCSVEFYTVFLDGEHYPMDDPIVASRDILCRYVSELNGKIVYLSGRRQGTEEQTELWLRQHQFPNGQIIHRAMGQKSVWFKSEWLEALRRKYWIDAHIGDRLEDDERAARYSGVQFVHIKDHQWPTADDLFTKFR